VSQFTELAADVRQQASSLDRQAGQATAVATAGKAAQARVEELRAQVELHRQVAALYTEIGEAAQETAREHVEDLGTRALQMVFGEHMGLFLQPGERGGQATLDVMIRTVYGTKTVETPVMEATGGGVANVVGFVLRLVMLLLTPGARRFLMLDESFGMVSAEFEPRVAEFLAEVAAKANVQVALVTHSKAYGEHADRHIELEPGPDGSTVVKA
jgi:hypothetical protein